MKQKAHQSLWVFSLILLCLTLIAGQVQPVKANVPVPASIGDRVWNDLNRNGIQDSGESGMDAVEVDVFLCGTKQQVASAVTDANGFYQVDGLTAGASYYIRVVKPTGYSLSPANVGDDALDSDIELDHERSACFTPVEGENNGWDVGLNETVLVTLGNFVWNDMNMNGVQDEGEQGLAGVTVNLYTCGGKFLVSTTTDADGFYQFTDRKPISYQIQFIRPDGYEFSPANQSADDEKDSDAGPDGMAPCAQMASGQTNNSIDAGVYMPKQASLGDRVWEDLNANGIQDGGEPGIPGVAVSLYTCGDVFVASTQTDASGFYKFSALASGQYYVVFATPQGFQMSAPDQGMDDTADSDAGPLGKTGCITLPAGQTDLSVDAGFFRGAALGDKVWDDRNYNGLQDEGEPGLGNVTVKLYTCEGVFMTSTQTDASGIYSFSGLVPGAYKVEFVSPSGYSFTMVDPGLNPGLDSNADSSGMTACVTVISGQTESTIDAGLYRPAALGDKVWEDLNANGIQDMGEPGVEGVVVQLSLCDAAGTLMMTTTTAADGSYSFTGLLPGTYKVKFFTPDGYSFVPANSGSNDEIDSDAGADGLTGCVTLLGGQTNNTLDAGLVRPATLGDKVWDDSNANGIQDNGESGIAGVTVRLYTCGDVFVAQTTTDASGLYSFPGLKPGSYKIEFVKPDGSIFVAANQGSDIALDSDANSNGFTGCFTVVSGETNNTVDAGLYRPASLGDKVWEDQNGNGIQDNGEPGIAGVIVKLYTCGDVFVAETTTDASGLYSFAGLKPGSYKIEFVKPDGTTFSMPNQGSNDLLDSDADTDGFTGCVTVVSGQTNNSLDAGLARPATLGDKVWEDQNGNGIQDMGEPGIPGVTVKLYTCGNVFVAETTTDASGLYSFAGLTPGSYKIEFVKPDGSTFTMANQGSSDLVDSDADSFGKTACVTLVSGETNTSLDAGLIRPATLGDKVWEDQNGNGIQDMGEPGISGVTVKLYTCGDVFVAETTTDASGLYSFPGLTPGSYKIEFVKPDGTTFTMANQGSNDLLDSDADTNGFTGCVTLVSGETNTSLDAGLIRPATLGDKVWEDQNGNGIQDNGESGIAGVTVKLYTCGDVFVAQTTTDASGLYSFAGLKPGSYKIEFVKPDGSIFVAANQGSDIALDSDANSNGFTGCFTVVSGETNNTVDAGLYRPASLGDKVWEDQNGNGIQDNGEPGIAGVIVKLYTCGDVFVAETTTDASGLYSFPGLKPGSYKVEFVKPDGTIFSMANQGSNDLLDSDADTNGFTGCVTVVSGETNNSLDAGLIWPATLGDKVWEDQNGNGIQDNGERGISGVMVRLYTCNGTSPIATTLTDVYGLYSFAGLNPGSYKVEFVKPDGSTFTMANQGSSDLVDSDADSFGKTACVTLVSGETNNSLDAGLIRPATLGDKVWNDLNANGIQDMDEPGIAGVTVRLYTCDGTTPIATTQTDASGLYSFANLNPGSYKVEFVKPDGTTFSMPNLGSDDMLDSDANGIGFTGCVTLASGETNTSLDAGLIRPATLGDKVWSDLNGNGIQDMGEPGIAGVTVKLYTCDGEYRTSVQTNASGLYSFAGLMPGAYKVEFIKPDGTAFSMPNLGGNDALDSDANSVGMTGCVTLVSGQTNNTLDAGLIRLASLGDKVWNDLNANGIQDMGEAGIANVTVRLYTCDGTTRIATTQTDASGLYSFTGLMPGAYKVIFTSPSDYIFSMTDQGSNDLIDSDANAVGVTACVTLAQGENNTSIDAGMYRMAKIGDYVWEDANKNGIQDTGEKPLSGITVSLYTCGGEFVTSMMTDVYGKYGFSVTPGAYYVEFTRPADYAFSPANQGTNDALDSDAVALANTVIGRTACTTLISGENDTTWDAGLYKKDVPGSIGDFVWLDSNKNGIYDPVLGELPIAKVVVQLYDCNGKLLATQTTNSAGYYLFNNLMPGCYTVVIAQSNFNKGGALYGMSQTYDFDGMLDNKTRYNLSSGEQFLKADFGYRPTYSPGTGTPGYWFNHPEAWPVEFITIGGKTYTKEEAIVLMKAPTVQDKTFTLFQALVAAKLNAGIGNDISCVSKTIADADAWMAKYPVGSDVAGSSNAWKYAEPLYLTLDKYNNGGMCAPHRN